MFRGKQNYIESQGRYSWIARPSVIFLQTSLHHSLTDIWLCLGDLTLWLFQAAPVFFSPVQLWARRKSSLSLTTPDNSYSFLKSITFKFQVTKLYCLLSSLLQSPIPGSGILAPCHSLLHEGCKNSWWFQTLRRQNLLLRGLDVFSPNDFHLLPLPIRPRTFRNVCMGVLFGHHSEWEFWYFVCVGHIWYIAWKTVLYTWMLFLLKNIYTLAGFYSDTKTFQAYKPITLHYFHLPSYPILDSVSH